ncbi:nicotinamide riboside transporter PnuC [Flavobacterium circumlabens]|uniref:Nicotinamide riboside transporter PnuC n=1 Tax=Flavobacterium circumlabens TaxID=2133765 RepID=A0A4Y7UHL1_9FLAO|nr:nicotinamide riboside transporter PnuC [Flavobacterium circumlabens]TCN60103.1 nicotinamide mononucleotide transporter [Flavobacterium circumlabens]TEB45332.1 nicotinamide riboside transporter PnuC [Flavobacterium circumlabens]
MDTTLEILGAIFGFLAVYFTIRQNIWCWFFGLIQVIIYCFVFYTSKLYSDMILHIIYIVLQVFGWYSWKYGGSDKGTLRVTLITNSSFWIGLTVVLTLLVGYIMQTRTDAACPYLDAFIMVASLVAQYLMIKKVLESWLFWIAVDVVAIGVYGYKALYFTTVLYVLFLIMAIVGYFEWKKAHTEEFIYDRQT